MYILTIHSLFLSLFFATKSYESNPTMSKANSVFKVLFIRNFIAHILFIQNWLKDKSEMPSIVLTVIMASLPAP